MRYALESYMAAVSHNTEILRHDIAKLDSRIVDLDHKCEMLFDMVKQIHKGVKNER